MMKPSGHARAVLGGLLLLFVASRLLYVVLIHPSYLDPQPGDELYVGTIAHELLTGLKQPFAEYSGSTYMLGTLVMGTLAAGFFLLFGPTVFALKLASLLVFTLALVFWYWTIQRAAGERVAGYFAVLFCFSPPLLTAYSVATLGGHGESILFSALTVFLLFRMLSVGAGGSRVPVAPPNATGDGPPPALEEKPSLRFPALLGLTAGIGLWFCYTYGLTLLAMLGFWLWHDTGMLRRPRFAWFALGFAVGFAPWILINLQSHFAGLVIQDAYVWEHFGLHYLWDDLAHPRKLAPYEFFADIASNDPRDLPRRTVNLLYSFLYLGPILTACVLRLKSGRAEPAGANYRGRGPITRCIRGSNGYPTRPSRTHPTRLTLVGFGILYIIVFALAVQFSDFRDARYHLPAYPFLFFLTAHSLARCQDLLPLVQRQIHTVFLASVVVLGLGTHAPLVSLDRPGFALSAKGYAYASMPGVYLSNHNPPGADPLDREFIVEAVQRPFLSDILPKLSPDDQRELSRTIALLLANAVSFNGRGKDFARLERLVPPGFEREFYYHVGAASLDWHRNEVSKAIATMEFLRHRSAAAHRLALIGIYRTWPWLAALDSGPEALAKTPGAVAPELLPHYWRALGHLTGQSWYNNDRSLRQLDAHLQTLVPRLDPSEQRFFLQGVGQGLFMVPYPIGTHWVAPAELERLPQAYQEGLLEGWGMALGEDALFSGFPWHGPESPLWMAWTKGLSASSLVSVQQGKAHFVALFEGPDSGALKPAREAP
jgi:4-amino-4-deoxy-L-arabinose transferase-like glycosyltransferase